MIFRGTTQREGKATFTFLLPCGKLTVDEHPIFHSCKYCAVGKELSLHFQNQLCYQLLGILHAGGDL